MFIRMIGVFEVRDGAGQDRTPRGSKARALLAMLCRTPGHRRPRRWLEARLWSDRGQEQASGSLRQALTELRKALGPLAARLDSDRDCIGLAGVTSDLDRDPVAARAALASGREFLEGIDIVDTAFNAWLAEERQRVAVELGEGQGPQTPEARRLAPISLRLGAMPVATGQSLVRDLGAAIARLTAEYLLLDPNAAGCGDVGLPETLDLEVEGAWSDDRAHLRVRLVDQASRKTLWTQRLVASRVGEESGRLPSVVFETTEAALM